MMPLIQTCLGWHGAASALAWAVAAVLCLGALRRARRERAFVAALGLALLACALACWNSTWAGRLRLDRSDEIRVAQEDQQRLLIQEEQARHEAGGATVRFAEDAPGDTAGAPAYRAGGKQKRAAGKVDAASGQLANTALRGVAPVEGETAVTLKLPEYQLATRMSRINSLLAVLVMVGVLGVMLTDYLRRFNDPVVSYGPLPLAGRWVNAISPGQSVVKLKVRSTVELAQFLEQVTRKGQTFAYFGDRLKAGDVCAWRLRLGRRGVWPLRSLTWGQPGVPRDWDFIFDAVWFGRYGVFVSGAEGLSALRSVAARLAGHAALRATAAALPHLVCDLGPGMEPGLMEGLRRRCELTGVRLVVVEEGAEHG